MKFHHRRAATARYLVALGLLCCAAPVWAVGGYTITDLGNINEVNGINASGQVVGDMGGSGGAINRAFLYSNGAMSDLGTLPGGTVYGSIATSINASGQVVGSSTGSFTVANVGNQHAFLYSNGVMSDLGALPGSNYNGTTDSGATAINTSGQVVGASYTASGNLHAFLYSNGTMSDIGTLPGGYDTSVANGINASGQVVGYDNNVSGQDHAFLYNNGVMSDLGTLPGGHSSVANGINASGQVVGESDITILGYSHAFLYSNGVMSDLGMLPGRSSSVAYGINATGQVVGSSGPGGHAFLYSNGTMTDLNSVLSAGSGWTALTAANAINDSGQIVGVGIIANGYQDAFLLTPAAVPVPAAVWLMGSGLLGLVGVARRKRTGEAPLSMAT